MYYFRDACPSQFPSRFLALIRHHNIRISFRNGFCVAGPTHNFRKKVREAVQRTGVGEGGDALDELNPSIIQLARRSIIPLPFTACSLLYTFICIPHTAPVSSPRRNVKCHSLTLGRSLFGGPEKSFSWPTRYLIKLLNGKSLKQTPFPSLVLEFSSRVQI